MQDDYVDQQQKRIKEKATMAEKQVSLQQKKKRYQFLVERVKKVSQLQQVTLKKRKNFTQLSESEKYDVIHGKIRVYSQKIGFWVDQKTQQIKDLKDYQAREYSKKAVKQIDAKLQNLRIEKQVILKQIQLIREQRDFQKYLNEKMNLMLEKPKVVKDQEGQKRKIDSYSKKIAIMKKRKQQLENEIVQLQEKRLQIEKNKINCQLSEDLSNLQLRQKQASLYIKNLKQKQYESKIRSIDEQISSIQQRVQRYAEKIKKYTSEIELIELGE